MSNGILLFAHNNKEIDYGKIAYVSAKFAQKNLSVPVSLVTDSGTVLWMKEKDKISVEDFFDKIILTGDPGSKDTNIRRYYDGSLTLKRSEFKNNLRVKSYEFSPYDNTLVIDVDMLIVNDSLSSIWETNVDFMINKHCYDLSITRDIPEFRRLNDTGIDFYWATSFFFRKTLWTKTFFDLCQHILENYKYYRFIYKIDDVLLRNDYIFSIALHIMGGFSNKDQYPSLPCDIYYCLDRDELFDVKNEKSFLFLIEKKDHFGEYTLAKTNNQNIHVMNKFSLDRLSKKLLEVIK